MTPFYALLIADLAVIFALIIAAAFGVAFGGIRRPPKPRTHATKGDPR